MPRTSPRTLSSALTTLTLGAIVAVGAPGPAGAAIPADPAGPVTVVGLAASGLRSGSEIAAGQRLSSPNGQFHLSAQADGNVVLYVTSTGRARWATGTAGSPGRRLVMQSDGNLVLYGAGGVAVWASSTAGSTAARLDVTDDGALVLSWDGGERVLAAAPSGLRAGEQLVPGQSLVSPGGRFRLRMQPDGNLVESAVGDGPVWASGTAAADRAGLTTASLTSAGAFAVGGWTATADAPGTRLVVQDDGNVVLYAGRVPVWSRGEDERRRAASAAAAAITATIPHGDVYPDRDATPCGTGIYCRDGSKYSPRGFAYRNCTDFVAWKLGLGWSQIADGRNGHAAGWKQGWIERGRSVGTTAKVGAVAWWSRNTYGHVAYVVAVNPDGSAVVEQYNAGGTGQFSTQTVRAEAYLY